MSIKSLYRELEKIAKARRKVEKELAIIESKKCKRRFSLCLDCEGHNDCPRYKKHLKEIL